MGPERSGVESMLFTRPTPEAGRPAGALLDGGDMEGARANEGVLSKKTVWHDCHPRLLVGPELEGPMSLMRSRGHGRQGVLGPGAAKRHQLVKPSTESRGICPPHPPRGDANLVGSVRGHWGMHVPEAEGPASQEEARLREAPAQAGQGQQEGDLFVTSVWGLHFGSRGDTYLIFSRMKMCDFHYQEGGKKGGKRKLPLVSEHTGKC